MNGTSPRFTRLLGFHAVQTALHHDPERLTLLRLDRGRRDPRSQALLAAAERAGVAVELSAREELDRLAAGARHQGVVADYLQTTVYRESDLDRLLDAAQNPLVLVLDGVQDPHNLGACLRTAAAAGVSVLITPGHKAAALTPTARKVASGGAEAVPLLRAVNLARTLRRLRERGLWLIGAAAGSAQTIYQADFRTPCALILGGEHKGLRPLTRRHCDVMVKIPMRADAVASLNVSVASGVVLFEALRQRGET